MSSIARTIHPLAGALAIATIAGFMMTTLVAELAGSTAQIVLAKRAIAWGLLVLVPLLATAGASGFGLARKPVEGMMRTKLQRMRIVSANGILILVPSALFLAARASAYEFGGSFYAVQLVELLAGAINLTLLMKNMRDGLAVRRARGTGRQ